MHHLNVSTGAGNMKCSSATLKRFCYNAILLHFEILVVIKSVFIGYVDKFRHITSDRDY